MPKVRALQIDLATDRDSLEYIVEHAMGAAALTLNHDGDTDALNRVLETFERLALQAGREIMRIYGAGALIEEKSDQSPVTDADRAGERIILQGLREAFPETPIIAEEECSAAGVPDIAHSEFFLVDPLDGTREFIKRNGDFTVNIALIREGVPVAGVVYAPTSGRLFSAATGKATFVHTEADEVVGERRAIHVREGASPLTIVASRSHITEETQTYMRRFEAAEIVSVGSSLKFCLVAVGEADLYPRFGRTMEWDTAAGDAVLRAAGGATITLDGYPLTYGKLGAGFANPSFISCGKLAEIPL